MSYFEILPKVYYDSKGDGKFDLLTNIMTRVKLRDDIQDDIFAYDYYDVQDGETPEMIAHKYYDDQVRNPADFWSTYLKRRGYKTYFTGKWHISNISPKNIYDVTGTIRPGMPNYSDPKLGGNYRWDQRGAGYFRPSSINDNSWCPSNPIYGGFWEGGIHWSEVIRKEAVDFIYQAANYKEPFFMQIAFNAPHDPRQSPDEYIKKYPIEEIGIPAVSYTHLTLPTICSV